MIERFISIFVYRFGDLWGTQSIVQFFSSSRVCRNVIGSVLMQHNVDHRQLAADVCHTYWVAAKFFIEICEQYELLLVLPALLEKREEIFSKMFARVWVGYILLSHIAFLLGVCSHCAFAGS